jgi:hypothetical protein
MHWSRELLALTVGVRWRITVLVVIGLLIVAASLASLICAGRAIAAVFAEQVVASGRHADPVAAGGPYAQLIAAQRRHV